MFDLEYKHTLNMMQTKFPMKGGLPTKEPKIQENWKANKIYQKVLERTKDCPSFILHDGPPYANGDIHIGHALNKILKDMIVRYKSMTGYYAPYVPGWDTHGLPIEQALTNQKGIDRKKMSIAEFRKRCEEYAYEQIERQKVQFERLGVRGDFENPYITLKPHYEARQILVFGEMAKKGYIYKGLKPVYWSPSSESALAEAEIEYHDKKSPSIYVAFQVEDGKGILSAEEEVIIWTTTPWTLPANLGISVHPDLTYIVVAVNHRKFVICKDLLEAVTTELAWENPSVLREIKGKDLENITCKHPFYSRTSLVMCGEHVTTDAGTGCVHTAPGHGEDDFYIGQKYGLSVLCPVDDRGYMTEEAPGFEGMFIEDANKAIGMKLEENDRLLKLKFITHSYPHDWRTKKPVIFRATAQWFASIADFREELLQAIRTVDWIPAWGETRLYNMVRDRGDWCISRQRTWGVPIPVFYGENGEAILTDETIGHVAKLFREYGSNVWFEREAKDLLPEGFTHPSSPNGQFTKEMDIMDVWFDSGSSHQGVLSERDDLSYPADLYLEGSDQYRGWFNSSLSTGVAVTGQAPYKAVLSHGFTLDGEGRKMSKSLGNTIVPQKVMDQMGADILRLWVSSTDYQADVRVSDAILKQVSEVYRKLRNTFRFLLGNLYDFDAKKDFVSYENLHEVDQYMLIRLNEVVKSVRAAYDSYNFGSIYQTINNFVTLDMSAFYLNFGKDVLYIDAPNSLARRGMQTVLYETLESLVKLVCPILPHTAEEVWSYMEMEAQSVQLTDMPKAKTYTGAKQLKEKFTKFLHVRDEVAKAIEDARNEKIIGKSLEAKVIIYPSKEIEEILSEMKDDVRLLLIVSNLEIHSSTDDAPNDVKEFDGLKIKIEKAPGQTCGRCWVLKEDVGVNPKHPEICCRCADIIEA